MFYVLAYETWMWLKGMERNEQPIGRKERGKESWTKSRGRKRTKGLGEGAKRGSGCMFLGLMR